MTFSFFTILKSHEISLFAPNYWLFQKSGLILPENRFGRTVWIMLHEYLIVLICTELYELILTGSNLDLILSNLRITMVSVMCIVKSNAFIMWQDKWKAVIEYITEADKYERNTNDPTRLKIVEKYTNYCRRLTYGYWILIFLTFWATVLTPMMTYFSSSTFRESVKNGTESFPHIIVCWMPFDKDHFPGSWITVIYHTVLVVYGSVILAAYDAGVIVMMVLFGGKLDLIRIHCKQMLGTEKAMASDAEISSKIRELHQMHVTFLRYSKLFNSIQSPVMFFYVIVCSLMLCVTAYQLTSATTLVQKLLQLEYLFFLIAELFVFCWHSNDVMIKNQNVVLGPYESQWTRISKKQRKNIILLTSQLQIRQIYSAGPFTDLTIATFINILKGAYSYYTLLRD